MAEMTFIALVITLVVAAIGSGVYASYIYTTAVPMGIIDQFYALFLAVVLTVVLLLVAQLHMFHKRYFSLP